MTTIDDVISRNFIEYQVEMLKNIKYQNKLLFDHTTLLYNSDNSIKNIIYKLNDIHEDFKWYRSSLNKIQEKININNILLVCIFILQLFILFK